MLAASLRAIGGYRGRGSTALPGLPYLVMLNSLPCSPRAMRRGASRLCAILSAQVAEIQHLQSIVDKLLQVKAAEDAGRSQEAWELLCEAAQAAEGEA